MVVSVVSSVPNTSKPKLFKLPKLPHSNIYTDGQVPFDMAGSSPASCNRPNMHLYPNAAVAFSPQDGSSYIPDLLDRSALPISAWPANDMYAEHRRGLGQLSHQSRRALYQ